MTDNSPQSNPGDRHGDCPVCGQITGCRNNGRSAWGFCEVHGLRWLIDSNRFSSWKDETQIDWAENRKFLQRFCPVSYHEEDDIGFVGDARPTEPMNCGFSPEILQPADVHETEKRAELYRLFHVARLRDGYHAVQGPDAAPVKTWPGPFKSKLAASLFIDDLVLATVRGNPYDAGASKQIVEFFNLAGSILACIGDDRDWDRALAARIAWEEPWGAHFRRDLADELPF